MPWSGMPIAIGGEESSASNIRGLAYIANNRNEGVAGANDLLGTVVAGAMQFRVGSGSVVIHNRTAGYDGESYTDRMNGSDTVAVSPTGAGSGRSDLVVARIEDPNVDGQWSAAGTFTRVIPGVDPSTTTVTELGFGYSAIPLYRLDIPAGTTTQLTQAMAADLRSIANAQQHLSSLPICVPIADEQISKVSSTTWGTFPSVASWDIAVPATAQQARLICTWAQIQNVDNLQCHAQFRFRLGSVTSQFVKYDSVSANSYRTNVIAADSLNLTADMRGTTQTLTLEAHLLTGADGAAQMDGASAVVVQGTFTEDLNA